MTFSPFAAGSGQSIRIFSMTDSYPSIWSDSAQTTIGLKGITKSSNITRRTYVWDLYALADYFNQAVTAIYPGTTGEFCYIDNTDTANAWNSLWVENFSDDTGANVYYNLETPFATNVFNQPSSEKFVYTGQLMCSPLVSQNFTEGYAAFGGTSHDPANGIKTLYNLALIPGAPFFLASSISLTPDSDAITPSNSLSSFGPNFIDSMKFTVSGADTLSPVKITLSWQGGKSVVCGTVQTDDISPMTIEVGESTTDTYMPYRSASLIDCLISTTAKNNGIVNLTKSLVNVVKNESNDPQLRMTGMELSIKNSLQFHATSPTSGKYGTNRTIEQGPRFVTISKRLVSGTITLFSTRQDLSYLPMQTLTSGMTMYFGGPFIFAMPQIDWQKPQMQVQAGNGYIHTLNFIARVGNNTLSMYDPKKPKTAYSEFIPPQS